VEAYVYPSGIYMEVGVNKHDPTAARQAAIFKSNRSQAVRIPRELAFADEVKRVTIEPTGDGGLIIKPVQPNRKDWEAFFRDGPFVTDDFLADRNQGQDQEREPFD
jgi:antitoxin VapB